MSTVPRLSGSAQCLNFKRTLTNVLFIIFFSLQVSLYQACYVIAFCQSLVLCVYCTLVFSQRYHLFVWSVFSPKLLYETTKTLLYSVLSISVTCLTCFVVRTERLSLQKSEWRNYFVNKMAECSWFHGLLPGMEFVSWKEMLKGNKSWVFITVTWSFYLNFLC